MSLIALIITWINIPANAIGKLFLAPVGFMPGWLSNTLISAVAGVFLLILFKYTSNQKAIGRVRDNIKANMLALKLFKDSMAVTLQSQGRIFKGAFALLFYAIKPMLIMMLPVCFLFAQMGLWYQFRPLQPGEETLVTLTLNGTSGESLPDVAIEPSPGFEITLGPVHVKSKGEILWRIKAKEPGTHHMVFAAGPTRFEKELAVGDGFMRVSPERPGPNWLSIFLYPWEKPFVQESIVQSISIPFPDRISKTSGADWWVGYFFVVSMIFALIFKPIFKVRI